jgi:glutamyl-Q tRNA(Asp) synthetase
MPSGRFAPSPTGPLHFGSLVAALGSWMMARRDGGTWRVRVEDLDPPREVPGAAERQLATLRAFGMAPDGEVLWQSRRSEAYSGALERLLASGRAFECRCSRSDLAAAGGIHRACVPDGSAPEPAVRLRVPDQDLGFDDAIQGTFTQSLARDVGDFVLRRADGLWAYQLAVVVDDAFQLITDVVRGADLLDSTPRQIFLQRQLGLPTPRYAHLPLVLGADGSKLAKSLGALPVDDDNPFPALAAAWRCLGQSPSHMSWTVSAEATLHSALANFDPARIPRVRSVPASEVTNPA